MLLTKDEWKRFGDIFDVDSISYQDKKGPTMISCTQQKTALGGAAPYKEGRGNTSIPNSAPLYKEDFVIWICIKWKPV